VKLESRLRPLGFLLRRSYEGQVGGQAPYNNKLYTGQARIKGKFETFYEKFTKWSQGIEPLHC